MNSLVLCFILFFSTASDQVTQNVAHGQINWTDKTLTVTGSGAPNLKAANAAAARLGAERAAKLDAMRNALETIRGLRLSGNIAASTTLDATPELKAKVSGVIQGFKTADIKYYSDGGVDVILTGPLDGILSELLATNVGNNSDSATVAEPAVSSKISGIIINSKGLKLTPALTPKLVDEEGNIVYSAAQINIDAFREHGMIEYIKNIELAKKSIRIGTKPLIIKAKALAAPKSADIIITNDDAQKIRKLSAILTQGKVVIVCD
ncbi:MAG: hypothetical protein JW841_03150 [Deltaproteobacteria bacterium]|nr:hypothetical protein [Deltaproteobacteria bacterium]